MIVKPTFSAAALLVVVLSACGQGGAAGGTSRSSDPVASGSPDRHDAAAALLTAADLPQGWSAVPNPDDDGASDSCLDKLAGPGGPVDREHASTATFAAGKAGPFVTASVTARPAEVVLREINDILVACDGSSIGGFTTSIEPASIPGFPDGGLVVRGAETTSPGGKIRFTIAAAGTEKATSFLFGITPLGEIDDAVVASAINAMYGRLGGT